MKAKFYKVSQPFKTQKVADIEDTVNRELMRIKYEDTIKKGDNVAIAVGSRGITNISQITKSLVMKIKELKATPFIVPAMGSHGGATAEGQVMVLATLGITEEKIGCKILSSMDTVTIGKTGDGITVRVDKKAAAADHIIPVNRIKLHTSFLGGYQSGIVKLLTIGLGKHDGAQSIHNALFRIPPKDIILKNAAQLILNKYSVPFGIAILEDWFCNTAKIQAIPGKEILKTEPGLLKESVDMFPDIPFDKIDILIIDEMGKDISGPGMDPNVIGKKEGETFIKLTDVSFVFVRDLSDKTYGNAAGIGQADFTTKRLVDKIDRHASYVNCLTGGKPYLGKIPPYFDSDKEVFKFMLRILGTDDIDSLKVVWIKNTKDLAKILINEKLYSEAGEKNISIDKELLINYDEAGNLKKLSDL